MNRERCVEVLAPAGSYDSFRAALAAGADAVYAGGPHFGARAYAENFTEEQLLQAIDEAHLHGRRLYLTVNTLVKDQELPQLYSYLEPLYRGGLDAVIVQDAGVFQTIRSCFPGLDIHASTQMTITGAEGAEFLKECGAVRVVPARELSLEEIRHMKQATGMEIECFVHGALCYCYSGQCLLSSLIGGRSGNRGQCAQPCRLRYTSGGEKGYLLSLKDICTLELIPDLIEAGIDSFKIEGRMKRPEYVAGVTSMYRKYVDLYLSSGMERFCVSKADQEMLMDLYNRGGFHTGYYIQRASHHTSPGGEGGLHPTGDTQRASHHTSSGGEGRLHPTGDTQRASHYTSSCGAGGRRPTEVRQYNGRDMIAADRPNHAGVPAVKIMEQKGREVTARALTEIHKGDVLAFPQQGDHTFGKDYGKGSMLTIPLPRGRCLEKGLVLYRIRNEKLLREIQDFWKQRKIKEKIYGFLRLFSGEPAIMTVCRGEVSVEAASELAVERAEKSPLDEARIRRQLEKTGNTEFEFENLEIELEEGVFLPMQQINELRRRALDELRTKICRQFYRMKADTPAECFICKNADAGNEREGKYPDIRANREELLPEKEKKRESTFIFSALVETLPQLEEVCAFPEVSRVYIDSAAPGLSASSEALSDSCARLRRQGREIYLAVPHILRKQAIDLREEHMKCFSGIHFDGILLRNYESFALLKAAEKTEAGKEAAEKKAVEEDGEAGSKQAGFGSGVILDHNLYVMNQAARTFWNRQGVEEFTVPVELNRTEIGKLGAEHMELLIYGYLPVMVSAQCITKTVDQCRKQTGMKENIRKLTDRYGNPFYVEKRCQDCYNIIYNSVPLCLFDEKEALREIGPSRLRLQFSIEDRDQTRQVLLECRRAFSDDAEGKGTIGEPIQRPVERKDMDSHGAGSAFTRGHFRRGVL